MTMVAATNNDDGAEGRPPHSPWWHNVLTRLLAAVTWTFGALPSPIAYFLADLGAIPIAVLWLVSDRRGKRVRGYWRNVRIVYRDGGLGTARPRLHLWKVARHLTWLAVDSCRLHRITKETLHRVVDLRELETVLKLHGQQKGIIWATGHIGVWDVAGYACALLNVAITSVFRPSPIPGVDRIISKLRTGSGQVVVAKHNVVGTLRRALQRRETIGLLCDSAGRRGDSFPPFLGTGAATVATPALLSLSSGAPVVVVTAMRTGKFRFALRVWDVIPAMSSGDRAKDVERILLRINQGLGRAVAAHPEQWFWQGRRFKHRPVGEQPGPDGLPPVAITLTSS